MAGETTELVAVGLSHKTAPVAVRERFALDGAGVRDELEHLRATSVVREAMLLCTCNRVELYAVPEPGAEGRIRDYFLRKGGVTNSIPVDDLLYWHQGRAAVLHMFRVATSLDSLVIGEPQILGQVKAAVRLADESRALGAVLNRLTQRSLWLAKHVRTHTAIGRSKVGVGSAGVLLAQQLFSSLRDRRALLVGVGEMGRQVAKAMLNTGLQELLVANRTFDKSVELAQEYGGTPVRYERLADYLGRVDIVITATGATQPIIHKAEVKAALKVRRYRPLFLVDLAVPRNIDPAIDELDQAYLFNVDDLEQVMARGRNQRSVASAEAMTIVEREADRFAQRLSTLHINEGLGDITRHAETIRIAELARSERLLDGLAPDDREAVDRMTRSLVKKLLHHPLAQIRKASADGDEETVSALVRALIGKED